MKMLELHMMFACPEGVETNDQALDALGEYLVAYKGEPAITGTPPMPVDEWRNLTPEQQAARVIEKRETLWGRLWNAAAHGRRMVSVGSIVEAPGLVVSSDRTPVTQEIVDAL